MRELPEPQGRLVENIVHFARALRKAGVKLGPSQVEAAIRAVEAAGFTRKTDFYHTLRATMIFRPADLDIFDQIFRMFWRDPEFLDHMIRMLSPLMEGSPEEIAKKAAERRAAEALSDQPGPLRPPKEQTELEIDARFSWSANETLRSMDFEQMSAAELAEATAAIRSLRLPIRPVLTRRQKPAPQGRKPDLRATLRTALRRGGEIQRIARQSPSPRPPDLVALCDISGSMSVYSRLLIQFLHALTWAPQRDWGHVHGFTFGTHLSNITRGLSQKDPDTALSAIGQAANDWKGGTRIGEALRAFNKDWSRRVLGRGAVVLLITDGLERSDITLLETEAERLALSCRRLIWLNPLLRYDGFAPKAAGIRAILPHVTSLHACHSLDSLAEIADALAHPRPLA